MQTRWGRRVVVSTFCASLVSLTAVTVSGCGVYQPGTEATGAYLALPVFKEIPGAFAERLLSMYDDEDITIGSPPE